MLVVQMQATRCAVRQAAGRIVVRVNDQDRFVPCSTEANGGSQVRVIGQHRSDVKRITPCVIEQTAAQIHIGALFWWP